MEAENSEGRFFALSRDLLAISEIGSGYWSRVNPACTASLGWTAEELLATPYWDLIHPDDLALSRRIIESFERNAVEAELEHRLRCKDGDYRWISWKSAAYVEEGLLYCAGRDVTERKEYETRLASELLRQQEKLNKTHEELQDLTANLFTAQEDERRRISSDLHDSVVQQLAVVSMGLSAAGESLHGAPASLARRLGKIHGQVEMLLAETRRLSHNLHPHTLEHLGFSAALRALAEDFKSGRGLHIQCSIDETAESIPLPLATSLYRIAQESLSNVARHARRDALEVRLMLRKEANSVCLEVSDNGPGFEAAELPVRKGLGLRSMHERARGIGGSLSIASAPGCGTTVHAHIPLNVEVKV